MRTGNPIVVPAMVWSPIAQVPTNGFSQVIQTGQPGKSVQSAGARVQRGGPAPAGRRPSRRHALLESGFVNGPQGPSDEIYTIDSSTKGVLKKTIYCDGDGTWRFVRTRPRGRGATSSPTT
jgi:hypothetical protein